MTDVTAQESEDREAAASGSATLAGRIRRSFLASVGSIVFGMEDGTVSIFGLVFGVAASAPDAHAVLLAGATGAIAAAVSMMARTPSRINEVDSDFNDRNMTGIPSLNSSHRVA